jgi:1-acyl-sn-glycerol-3-phosphate acyltransferase
VPSPSYSPAAYRVTAVILRGLFRLYFRVEIRHAERVPRTGGLVLAANHATYMDGLFLGAFAPRPVRFMVLRNYYDLPVVHFHGKLLGSFPVDGEGVTRFTIRNCQEVLRAGDVMGIFPEGGRTRDGKLMPGKPGAMLMALREQVPVVPAGLTGIFESYPASRRFPRPGRIGIRFGEPITEHLGMEYPRDKEKLPELTDLLMARIRKLLEER